MTFNEFLRVLSTVPSHSTRYCIEVPGTCRIATSAGTNSNVLQSAVRDNLGSFTVNEELKIEYLILLHVDEAI